MGNSRLRFASALPALFLACLATAALAAGGGGKSGAPHRDYPTAIAQAPTERAGRGWESFYAIQDRFVMQQAVDAGLGAEGTRRMSAVLLTYQKIRLETLDLIGQGKITSAEMQMRARKARDEREEKLKSLLSEKIYAALDWDEASSHAFGEIQYKASRYAFLTGEQLVKNCNERRPNFCTGYIIAVVDSRLGSDPEGWGPVQKFCIQWNLLEGRADPEQRIKHAVLDYLAKTPAARAKVGFWAVEEALAAEFPC